MKNIYNFRIHFSFFHHFCFFEIDGKHDFTPNANMVGVTNIDQISTNINKYWIINHIYYLVYPIGIITNYIDPLFPFPYCHCRHGAPGGREGDKGGRGHMQILDKAPTDYTNVATKAYYTEPQ